MIKYFKNKDDSKKYTKSSGDRIEVTCDYCGRDKSCIISDLHNCHSIGCICGDNIKYPNKFMFEFCNQLLKQGQIKYFETEYEIENRKYDLYIELNNGETLIIENHGEQHGKFIKNGNLLLIKHTKGFRRRDEIKNDIYKCKLAYENKIDKYIQLDCSISSIYHIKTSIFNSWLSNLFDLSDIDWLKCGEFAEKNIVKEVCDYWNTKPYLYSCTDVSRLFGIGKNTVREYLNKGTKLGWCNYDPEYESTKGLPVEVFKDGVSLGVYKNSAYLSEISEKVFGVKLLKGSIANALKGVRQHKHKGFEFKQIKDSDMSKYKIITD